MLLTSLLVTSCTLNSKRKGSPIGNWSACSRGGMYVEMYLTDTTLTFQRVRGYHQSYFYDLKGDTLTYTIAEPGYKPTITIRLKIILITDSSVILESIDPVEKWVFTKIKEKVKLPTLTNYDLQSLIIYEEEKQYFLSRALRVRCVDKRSPAEITQDSLTQNSFRF